MILRNPSETRDFLFRACLFFLLIVGSVNADGQGVNGVVRDHASLQPLQGIQISFLKSDSLLATVRTNTSGQFSFKSRLTGRLQIMIHAKGFEPFYLDNISLDGYTTHTLDFNLEKISLELEGVTVIAPRPAAEPGTQRITREDLNTVAGNFDDPIRIAHSKPGVVLLNDQANHFSARGYSPVFNTYYLEGLQIVNPNHTNNAGLLDDRPTQFGGGINMFSAQMLGPTDIYTGISPFSIHRAGGAAINLTLHSTAKPEWRAKAGLLGFEFGGGTALGKKSTFDINLRYSFTGLLANMGVDFGGEKIGFYDGVMSYQSLGKFHKLKIFAFAGRSTNEFDRVEVPEERMSFKEFFDIDYGNTIIGSGLRYDLALGEFSTFRFGTSYSVNRSTYAIMGQFGSFASMVDDDEQMHLLSSFADVTWAFSESFHTTAGVQFLLREYSSRDFYDHPFGEVRSVRPYVQTIFSLASNLRAELGVEVYGPFINNAERVFGPRALLRYYVDDKSILFAGYQRSSTDVMKGGIFSARRSAIIDNIEAGWESHGKKHNITLNAYYQLMKGAVVHLYTPPANFVVDFPYLQFSGPPLGISFDTRSQHVGVEGSWHYTADNGWKMEINQTLFKSARGRQDSALVSGRYDSRFTINIALAKEVYRERNGKNRIWNFALRGLLHGGFREPEISFGLSDQFNNTVFRFPGKFDQTTPVFKRIDLSVSRTITTPGIRWRYALDIQNAFGFTNLAYHYFDAFLNTIERQDQLGIIPVLSVQASW